MLLQRSKGQSVSIQRRRILSKIRVITALFLPETPGLPNTNSTLVVKICFVLGFFECLCVVYFNFIFVLYGVNVGDIFFLFCCAYWSYG